MQYLAYPSASYCICADSHLRDTAFHMHYSAHSQAVFCTLLHMVRIILHKTGISLHFTAGNTQYTAHFHAATCTILRMMCNTLHIDRQQDALYRRRCAISCTRYAVYCTSDIAYFRSSLCNSIPFSKNTQRYLAYFTQVAFPPSAAQIQPSEPSYLKYWKTDSRCTGQVRSRIRHSSRY